MPAAARRIGRSLRRDSPVDGTVPTIAAQRGAFQRSLR
jgi:hypothetical protein